MAKLATASQEDLGRLIPIEHLPEPSISVDNGEVSPVMSEPSWMDPIWDYLVDGTLPSDPKEASKLRARSARFTVHRGTLYKRGFSAPILKCVGKEDANYILKEVHEGICGNHIGARTLVGKTLRQGYYWPTMLKDCDAPNPAPDGVSSEGVTLRDWDSLTFSFSELTLAFICIISVITKILSFYIYIIHTTIVAFIIFYTHILESILLVLLQFHYYI